MSYIIDTTKEEEINLAPGTVYEEVMQNLWFLYSSIQFDIPLDRELGLNATYIDKPIETARALITGDIYDKTGEYEPRAEIVSIDFVADYEKGVLKPVVEVEIDGGYDNEDDSG